MDSYYAREKVWLRRKKQYAEYEADDPSERLRYYHQGAS